MVDKQLKSIDKTKLLNIMRQQEIEIERVTNSSNEQIMKLNTDLQRMTAEKIEQNERIERIIFEKNAQNEQIEKLTAQVEKLTAEKSDQKEQKALLDTLTDKINYLETKNEELIKRLEERKFSVENAGSLADVSISVSGIMNAAQKAADVYLQNIKLMEEDKMAVAHKIENEAREKANAIIRAAELKREEIEQEERKSVEDLKIASKQYMDILNKAHVALHDIIKQYKLATLPPIDEPDQPEQSEQSNQIDQPEEIITLNQPEQLAQIIENLKGSLQISENMNIYE